MPDIQISMLQLLILALAGVLIIVLRLLIQGTKIGRAMRATAQDHEAAYAMGVNINRVFSISFSLASCLGGAAGVLVGIYYNAVYPVMGDTAGLKGFAACIFGGLTSIPGAILGGLIIGVVENLTVQFIASGYRDIVAFIVLVIVLVFRPQGILGKNDPGGVTMALYEFIPRRTNLKVWLPILGALALFPLFVRNEYILNTAVMAGIYIILASSLNITNGYTGLFSFGHAAFYGIGAYTAAILSDPFRFSFSPDPSPGRDRGRQLSARPLPCPPCA